MQHAPPRTPVGLRGWLTGASARSDAEAVRHNDKKLRARMFRWQVFVFVTTFVAYVSFHSARKAFSNAKSELNDHWGLSTQFLGNLDSLFLFFYAFGLYFSGIAGDQLDPIRVLLAGMIGSAVVVSLFGLATELQLRHKGVLAVLWCANGLFQSTGWPTTVHIMGNWFDERTRGRVFGGWSANASTGNIVGSLLVTLCLAVGLGIPFMFLLPSAFIAAVAAVVFFFLPARPRDVFLPDPEEFAEHIHVPNGVIDAAIESHNEPLSSAADESTGLLSSASSGSSAPMLSDAHIDYADAPQEAGEVRDDEVAPSEDRPLSFKEALLIPGVIPYSLAYACIKMVNYSLFFWLPYYLDKGLHFSSSHSDLMSNTYDVGQVLGGLIAGLISDRMGCRSPVTVLFLIISVGLLGMYRLATVAWHVALLMGVSGFFIGGPANLISSAISADLGSHESIKGNAKALSTVTGIIDGTGSVGAAIGQSIVAYISDHYSWDDVFVLLMSMTALSTLCIGRLFIRDMRWYLRRRRPYDVAYDADAVLNGGGREA